MAAVIFNPDTVNPQQFSTPRNIIYYILMNPKSPKTFLKMIYCCKYFYSKNKILIAESPEKFDDIHPWKAEINNIVFEEIPDLCTHKFWITERFSVLNYDRPNWASTFLQKVKYCDIYWLTLVDQKITWKEFKLLTSAKKIKTCNLSNLEIINDKNETVLFEKILEQLPSLKWLDLVVKDNDPIITPDTVSNILKLPKFDKLEKFYIKNIPEIFDLENFVEFMDNSNSAFFVQFIRPINEDTVAKYLNIAKKYRHDFPRRIHIEF